MKFLRNILDKQGKIFERGGKLEKLYPLWEANDTLLYTPGSTTKGNVHVRDALDLKRMMITVVVALTPILGYALYNTGAQANKVLANGGAQLDAWQYSLYNWIFGIDAAQPGAVTRFALESGVLEDVVLGLLFFLPVFIVTFASGGFVEVVTSIVRKHEVNEGFLVTGFLIPLIMPPTIPLWMVAVGTMFGVLIGKEVFGGTGMNILNPALTARAFLFFAYPAEISGDAPWIAATQPDGYSGATMLAEAAAADPTATDKLFFVANGMGSEPWMDAFLGRIPGSMGETSTLLCLVGAFILIVTQIGSWRTMLGVVLGTAGLSFLLNAIGSDTNALFALPFHWHVVLGGWAFGMVFMATDPVSSAFTQWGKLIYGFGIGAMVVLVRVVNPAYPEGMMLAILFMNVFAPLIDHFFVQANIKRRLARNGA